jgi:hypothetical protein
MPYMPDQWYLSDRAEQLKRVHDGLTPEQREQLTDELDRRTARFEAGSYPVLVDSKGLSGWTMCA